MRDAIPFCFDVYACKARRLGASPSADPKASPARGSVIHRLKTHTPVFRDVVEDRKSFEIRRNDRDFRVGDVLRLEEWNDSETGYTGAYTHWQVTYLVQGVYGLPADVCVMGIAPAFHRQIEQAKGTQ